MTFPKVQLWLCRQENHCDIFYLHNIHTLNNLDSDKLCLEREYYANKLYHNGSLVTRLNLLSVKLFKINATVGSFVYLHLYTVNEYFSVIYISVIRACSSQRTKYSLLIITLVHNIIRYSLFFCRSYFGEC